MGVGRAAGDEGRWRACAERRHACTGWGGEAGIQGGAGIKYRQHARGDRGSAAAEWR